MFLINDIGCTSVNCCFMLFVRTKSNGLKILISNYNKCEKLGPGSCSVASSKYNNICGGSVRGEKYLKGYDIRKWLILLINI